MQVRPVNSTPFMVFGFTHDIAKRSKLDVYDLVVSSPLIITMDTIHQHKKLFEEHDYLKYDIGMLEIVVLCCSVQEEDILEHNYDGKCHMFTF